MQYSGKPEVKQCLTYAEIITAGKTLRQFLINIDKLDVLFAETIFLKETFYEYLENIQILNSTNNL